MTRKRREFTAEFKVRVALAAMKEDGRWPMCEAVVGCAVPFPSREP